MLFTCFRFLIKNVLKPPFSFHKVGFVYLEAVLLGAYKFVILIFWEWFLLLCNALFFVWMLFFLVIFCGSVLAIFWLFVFSPNSVSTMCVLAIFSDYYFMAYINAFFLPVLLRYNWHTVNYKLNFDIQLIISEV